MHPHIKLSSSCVENGDSYFPLSGSCFFSLSNALVDWRLFKKLGKFVYENLRLLKQATWFFFGGIFYNGCSSYITLCLFYILQCTFDLLGLGSRCRVVHLKSLQCKRWDLFSTSSSQSISLILLKFCICH